MKEHTFIGKMKREENTASGEENKGSKHEASGNIK